MEILFQIFGPLLGYILLATGIGAGLWGGYLCLRARKNADRAGLRPGACLLTWALLTLPLCFLCIVHSSPFNRRSFDRRGWAASDFRGSCQRGQMVGDLLRFHLKVGASRERVLYLLGKPDEQERERDGQETYRYLLGACSGFQIDSDYLSVYFDASGRMVGAQCWQS